MSQSNYRLPKTVLPKSYAIDIDASPKRKSFFGVVQIDARVLASTSSVELHARDLKITQASVRSGTGRAQKAHVETLKDRETILLRLTKPLPKGRASVRVEFKGQLNPSMHGLYLAQDGAERALVTQCEATDARAIFPCFDEPEFKATFQWTVRTDPGYEVITNGVLASQSKTRTAPARQIHRFKPTKVISSYLVALTIGKLEGTAVQRVVGVPCRVWAGKGKLDQTDFATQVTAQVLPWYERYFGQKYNYQKLDQVAVPGFDAGAMENVGAIFYRQNLLLMKPESTSWAGQKRIAEVIAHEIAHQWFGNLVTMKWWDDLWLNEAFATWIAFKAVNEWQPSWRMWDDFLESKESALAADALVNTHPIYAPVESPAEATELFDVITYEKGCAVLRMAETYLSPEIFRDGIQRYQAAFKNSNAAGRDLWTKLEEASNKPMFELMESWIHQSGFPLITVSKGREGDASTLHFSQRRFFASHELMQEDHEQVWTVPMGIRYGTPNGHRVVQTLLREREDTISLPTQDPVQWVYPNDDAAGFFRVRLDDDLLADLLEHGLFGLTPGSRMSLIEDQWALVRCGLSDIEQFMDVLAAFRNEHDYLVVGALTGRLQHLHQYLAADQARPMLSAFTRWLLQGQLDALGLSSKADEGPEHAVRRAALVHCLGYVGRDARVLSQAEEWMHLEMREPTAVEPNLAGTAIALAALRDDGKRLASYLDTYLHRKKARAAPELQSRYLSTLSYFESPAAHKTILRHCLDGTIPQEQLRVVIQPLLVRSHSQKATWAWLQKHWSEVAPKVGLMGIARLVESLGALPARHKKEIEQFFTKHPVPEAKRALQKALEAIDLRAELIAREQARLTDWLERTTRQLAT